MRLVPLLIVAGCSSSPAPRPLSNAPATPSADEARAYILGKGVARDYRRAAKLYAERCAGGCGAIDACRTYLELALRARGVVASVDDMKLAARLCNRGDRIACVVAAFAGLNDASKLEPRDKLQARCDAGDTRACEDELATDLGLSDSSSHEARMGELAERLCAANVIQGCINVIDDQWRRCRDHASATAAEPGDACIDWQVADWTQNRIDGQPLRAAWQRVTTACSEGDADACELVPGRTIAATARCDAGDFERCVELAEAGDKHAASIACTAGMTEMCTPARDNPNAARALGSTIRFLEQACRDSKDPKACAEAKRLATVSPCP